MPPLSLSLTEGDRGFVFFGRAGFLAGGLAFVRPVVAHKLGTESGSGGWNKQPSAKGKGILIEFQLKFRYLGASVRDTYGNLPTPEVFVFGLLLHGNASAGSRCPARSALSTALFLRTAVRIFRLPVCRRPLTQRVAAGPERRRKRLPTSEPFRSSVAIRLLHFGSGSLGGDHSGGGFESLGRRQCWGFYHQLGRERGNLFTRKGAAEDGGFDGRGFVGEVGAGCFQPAHRDALFEKNFLEWSLQDLHVPRRDSLLGRFDGRRCEKLVIGLGL